MIVSVIDVTGEKYRALRRLHSSQMGPGYVGESAGPQGLFAFLDSSGRVS